MPEDKELIRYWEISRRRKSVRRKGLCCRVGGAEGNQKYRNSILVENRFTP